MTRPRPQIADLRGLWRRALIAWPDGRRDETTQVWWLQGALTYVDLRQPSGAPDFADVRGLADLSENHCAWLAVQEGFAGRLGFDGAHFEWARAIDFQPRSLQADAGSLEWEHDLLVETGRDVAYVEHWRRDGTGASLPAAAVSLTAADGGQTQAALLRVGAAFMFARDRAVSLPPHRTLAECVAEASTLDAAQALVDCEISFGQVTAKEFQITASTLPYRVGDRLGQRRSGAALTILDRDADGRTIRRRWDIVEREGDLTHLDAPHRTTNQEGGVQ